MKIQLDHRTYIKLITGIPDAYYECLMFQYGNDYINNTSGGMAKGRCYETDKKYWKWWLKKFSFFEAKFVEYLQKQGRKQNTKRHNRDMFYGFFEHNIVRYGVVNDSYISLEKTVLEKRKPKEITKYTSMLN